MPAPRRRGAKPEPTTEAPVTETVADGSEDKPKRTRAPKDYKIMSEEMAELVNETLDSDDHSEGDAITGELISQLREGGMKWDGADEKPGIKFVAGIKSAIPLRTLLQKYEADGEGAIDADDADAIVTAMKSDDAGWTQLSARTGLSVADVKAAIKEKLAEEDIDVDDGGRGYGKGDGWRWVTREELNASKVANKAAADAEPDEDDEDEDDDDDTPAPPARRRGRAAASA